MSANRLDKPEILYVVMAAMRKSIVRGSCRVRKPNGHYYLLTNQSYDLAIEVCQMIDKENIKSLDSRYGDESEPHEFRKSDFYKSHYIKFDPVQVLASINYINYQNCEHSEWGSSDAKWFLDSLKGHAISSLPGYEKAVWGVPDQVYQMSEYCV